MIRKAVETVDHVVSRALVVGLSLAFLPMLLYSMHRRNKFMEKEDKKNV